MRRRCVVAAASIALASTRAASATPQYNVSGTNGISGVGTRDDRWAETYLSFGLRSDALFGRNRDFDLGIGPYVEALTTASFHDAAFGGGATVLLPVHEYLPIILSAGPYARHTEAFGWEPGVATSLFFGSRGFNYHSKYSLSGGLLLQSRYGLGDSRELTFIIGAEVDIVFITLPAVVLVDWIRHW